MTAGDDYTRELIGALPDAIAEYDAEAAANAAAKEIPPFGRFVRESIAAKTDEEDGS